MTFYCGFPPVIEVKGGPSNVPDLRASSYHPVINGLIVPSALSPPIGRQIALLKTS
jgi:hypothetical protein